MKGDFSRKTFDQRKHYTGVHMQQGRVQLDADWNEQADINVYQTETRMLDLVGGCGAPLHDAAFKITITPGEVDFMLSAGRYYVDGILCENETNRRVFDQPDLPLTKSEFVKAHKTEQGFYVAYLDVWQRHLTAIDDPSIREIALGGPDTATRVKTIWQVKLLFVGRNLNNPNCLTDLPDYNAAIAPSTGTLKALQAPPTDPGENLCIVPPGAGYQGMENQLYRVEIHRGGGVGTATFKWSRENGSVVTTIEKIKSADITVRDIGPDGVLGFARDQWVEITDDSKELNGERGELRQIKTVDPAQRIITLKTAATKLANNADGVAPLRHPKLRRWDYGGTVGAENALLTATTPVELESGVQVQFPGGRYQTGDYWLIPARTATADAQSGNIEWPVNSSNNPLALTPFGIKHHYCRIALLKYDNDLFTLVQDCRSLFPPGTELRQLFYSSGDGQEVKPDVGTTAGPVDLPLPVVVGVSNGRWPVEGAKVRFEVQVGDVRPGQPIAGNALSIDVATDANGLASCRWRLSSDKSKLVQTLRAMLLDASGTPTVHIPITFNANLSLASEVAYVPGKCDDLKDTTNVQDALDLLCQRKHGGSCSVIIGKDGEFKTILEALTELLKRGQHDICLCLLPGEHLVERIQLVVTKGNLALNGQNFRITEAGKPSGLQIKIEGCGAGTRLNWRAAGGPGPSEWFSLFLGVSLTMRDLDIDLETGGIIFHDCPDVVIESCGISQTRDANDDEMRALTGYLKGTGFFFPLLFFSMCRRFRIEHCRISQLVQRTRLQTYEVFVDMHPPLAEIYAEPDLAEFNRLAPGVAQKIQISPAAERTALAERINTAAAGFETQTRDKFGAVANFIQQGATMPPAALASLRDLNISFTREVPGIAIVIIDGTANATIHENIIEGTLCLYGFSPSPWRALDRLDLTALFKEGKVNFSNLGNNLSVRSNQLTRVAISRDMMSVIESMGSTNTPPINNVFRNAFFGDNDLKSPMNQFMARHLSLSSNVMTKLPMNQTLPVFISHLGVGRTAIYVGNHGSEGRTRLKSLTNLLEQAANLNLVIV